MAGNPKDEARRHYRALREGIPAGQRAAADAAIAEQLRGLREFAQANSLFTYLSVGAEVDTRAIVRAAWDAGKVVAVPRCVPGTNLMQWHRITSFGGLERGAFGIEEPPDDETTIVDVPPRASGGRAIALVPGLSFDAQGYRLGYGGGFYDVFLPRFGGTSVGLCRVAQFSEAPLARDEHDVPVDIVLSETRVTRLR